MDNKEFNEWVARSIPPSLPMTQGDMVYLRAALIEATRRADKRAREECCEIVRSERIANECALEEAYNMALTHAEQAIRATIPKQTR